MPRRGIFAIGVLVGCLAALPYARAQSLRKVTTAPAPAWIDSVPAEGASGGASTDTLSHGRRLLLFDEQVRLGRGSAPTERFERWSQQIVNESGLDAASQVKLEFDPTFESLVVHALTIRRDDQVLDRLDLEAARLIQQESNLDAQVYDGRQTLVLFVSDLRVGDVLDYAYTRRGADPTLGGKVAEVVGLGAPEPIARLRVRLTAPRERPVHWSLGGPPQAGQTPAESATDALTTYAWDLRDSPAIPLEPDTPGWYGSMPFASFSDFASWQEVASWGARLFQSPAAGPPLHAWVQARMREAASRDDFVLRALRFVQDEVRYVAIEVGMARRRPSDPNVVFARRYGDCKEKAALLVAILGDAGIRARPALVNSAAGHALDGWTPSPLAFDHAIVKVTMPGGAELWVDPTMTLQGGGLSEAQAWRFERALVLEDGVAGLAELPPAPDWANVVRIVDRYFPPPPGDAHGEARLHTERSYQGEVANVTRAVLHTQTREAAQNFIASRYETDFPGVRVSALDEQDDRDANVVRLKADVVLPRFWTPMEDGAQYAATLKCRSLESFLARPGRERRTPLRLSYPLHVEHEIETALPFELTSTSESSAEDNAAFRSRFAAAYHSRTLTYRYELDTKTPDVAVADLGAYRAAIDKVDPTLTRSLTYRPIGPDGISWIALAVVMLASPLFAWGAWAAYRYAPRRLAWMDGDSEPPIIPIGGWLIVLGLRIGLSLVQQIGVTWTGASLLVTRSTWRLLTPGAATEHGPGLLGLLALEHVSSSAMTAYWAVLLLLFVKRKRTFPFHLRIALVWICIYSWIDAAGVAWLKPSGTDSSHAVRQVLLAMGAAAIWIPYLHLSRRVAKTFVLA
jgi:transglutaminase-like putative cysteine protease